MAKRWRPGDAILIRHVHFGRVFLAMPARVVCDEPDLVAWSVAPGTRCVYPVATDAAGALLPAHAWSTRPHRWFGNGNLDLVRPWEPLGIRLFWAGDGSFRSWYVNAQEPLRRTARGFDFRDLALDLIVRPDGSVELKDEEHLVQGKALGIFSPDEVRLAREACALALRERDERFPTGWEEWRPDPEWTIPELPRDWDDVG